MSIPSQSQTNEMVIQKTQWKKEQTTGLNNSIYIHQTSCEKHFLDKFIQSDHILSLGLYSIGIILNKIFVR